MRKLTILSLKARALNFLATREHSRLELGRKLARYAKDGDDVESLLDELEAAKLLSATRFSESLIHRKASKFGNSRILSELQSHGIDADALAEIKTNLVGNEAERAREVWRKKFGNPPTDAADYGRQTRFLLQRGFSLSTIKSVIKGEVDDDE